jgi:hypothetical protein
MPVSRLEGLRAGWTLCSCQGATRARGNVVCPVVRDGTGWRARPVGRPDRDWVLPGRGDSYDRAIADFSVTHADRNEQDCAALVKAVESGRLPAETGL